MRKIFALTLALVLTLGASTAAFAAWSASGAGSALASSGTVNPPTGVSASATGTTVDVTWTASGSGATPTSYTVVRQPAPGNSASSSTVCTPTHPTTNCSDSGVPAGDWIYAVSAQVEQWTSSPDVSSTVTIDDAPAEETFQVVLSQSGAKRAGDSFDIEVTAMDDGVKQSAYAGAKTLSFSGPGTSPSGGTPTYPASVTFNGGVATASITLKKAETVTLQIADGPRVGTTSVTVTPAMTALAFSGCPGSDIDHRETFEVTVVRPSVDSYGNSAVGSSASISIAPGGSGHATPTTVTIPSGSTTSSTITAGINGNNKSGSLTASENGYHDATCNFSS